jgi:hypothetical protein
LLALAPEPKLKRSKSLRITNILSAQE